MKAWSWRIGSIAGVPLHVHSTFVLLLIWLVAAAHLLLGDGFSGVLRGLLFIAGIFACIVLQELGHALVARRFGYRYSEDHAAAHRRHGLNSKGCRRSCTRS